MHQRARTFKTLALLVGAMTATSALLGWINPSEPVPTEAPSLDTALAAARSLVVDDVPVRRNRWLSAEVLAGPASPASARFLTATAGKTEYHFRVDVKGRVSRTNHWLRQETSISHPQTVQIQVARRGVGQPMSRAQWYGVRALITALHEVIAPHQPALPVRLQNEWAQVYDLEPDTVLELGPITPSPG